MSSPGPLPGAVWEKAAGIADLEGRASLTPRHRFRIGSVTKVFVATVVLQLVGEGALRLDDQVGPIAEGVTLRQLLNHTSGLPDHSGDPDSLLEPYRKNRAYRQDLTPRAALELVHAKPRLFPPGTGWSYSSGNYLVLGLLVEETTGATLREELRRGSSSLSASRQPICRTLSLPQPISPAPTSRRTIRCSPIRSGPSRRDRDRAVRLGGGEMVSTARDVARFLQALLGGELLAPSLRAEMLTTVASDWEESVGTGSGSRRSRP